MIRTYVASLAVCVGLATALWEDPVRAQEPSTDFTFKRVKVPNAGTARRITVQIGSTTTATVPGAPQPASRRPDLYDFFWTAVPSSRDYAPAARLALAIATIQAAEADGRPLIGNTDRLEAILADFGPLLDRAGRRNDVSAAFLAAVILVESAGRSQARSPKNAQGLMQLIPATAQRFGVSNAFDPDQNIAGGAAYLDLLLDLFDQDPLLALAGYNAGENAVIRAEGVPNYSETRAYVPLVLAAWLRARGLCATVPMTPRDPCDLGLAPRIPPQIRPSAPS
ncbi:MAG: lytic transglycosylase domain-containing protein [Pseudomonadota bacterium]